MKIKIFTVAILITAFVSGISAQQKEVKIYLVKDLERLNKVRPDWVAVKRTVEAKSQLRSALEWLFEPKLTRAEKAQKIDEIDFGMKFEGVTLKKGTATVRFSETDNANYITSSAKIFIAAVTKTARQFPGVKRVKICAVGETGFDVDYDKPLFYPCK